MVFERDRGSLMNPTLTPFGYVADQDSLPYPRPINGGPSQPLPWGGGAGDDVIADTSASKEFAAGCAAAGAAQTLLSNDRFVTMPSSLLSLA